MRRFDPNLLWQLLIILVVLAVLGAAVWGQQQRMEACESPTLLQVVPQVRGTRDWIYTETLYIYRCADGQTVESPTPLEGN